MFGLSSLYQAQLLALQSIADIILRPPGLLAGLTLGPLDSIRIDIQPFESPSHRLSAKIQPPAPPSPEELLDLSNLKVLEI